MADTAEDAPDVEILVHVTAPARAVDDAAHRQLAQAYLDFQPDGPLVSPEVDIPSSFDGDVASPAGNEAGAKQPPPTQPPRSQDSEVQGTGPTSPRYFVIDSQDLSFHDALDNRASPRWKAIRQRAATAPVTPNSLPEIGKNEESPRAWKTPPSQIADSYPAPRSATSYASPSTVLQQYIGQPASTRRSPHPPTTAAPALPVSSPLRRRSPRLNGVLHESQHKSESSSHRSSASSQPTKQPRPAPRAVAQTIIPVTPLPPRVEAVVRLSSGRKRTRAQPGDWDVTHISSTDSSLSVPPSPCREDTEPPPCKRSQTSDLSNLAARLQRDSTDVVRNSSDAGLPSSAASNFTIEQSIALEVLPPSPPVTMDDLDPSDLVTEHLDKLVHKLSYRYQPTLKRDINPLERGYWDVDCSAWPPQTRRGAWQFLYCYIDTGMAGWGVWCSRNHTHDSLRLYCWGHLLPHTYLMLYLATERGIKYTGADWKDASGEVILQVLPSEKRTQ